MARANPNTGESPVAHVSSIVMPLVPEFLELRRADVGLLFDAIDQNDMELARRLGHNMKGNGAAYGFLDISTIGHQIELSARASDLAAIRKLAGELAGYLDAVRIVEVT